MSKVQTNPPGVPTKAKQNNQQIANESRSAADAESVGTRVTQDQSETNNEAQDEQSMVSTESDPTLENATPDLKADEATEEEPVIFVTIQIPIAKSVAGHLGARCDIKESMIRKLRLPKTLKHIVKGYDQSESTLSSGKPVNTNTSAILKILECISDEMRKNGISAEA